MCRIRNYIYVYKLASYKFVYSLKFYKNCCVYLTVISECNLKIKYAHENGLYFISVLEREEEKII